MKEPSIVYSNNPFIASYDNILSQEECQILMDLAKENLQPSAVVGGSNTRKSDTAWLPHNFNEHVQQLTNRIASIALASRLIMQSSYKLLGIRLAAGLMRIWIRLVHPLN